MYKHVNVIRNNLSCKSLFGCGRGSRDGKMLLEIAVLLTLLCHGTIAIARGESVDASNLLRQRGSFIVPLRQRERPTWRRHLLRSGALSVEGSVREVGYFYTTLKLGTPARTFSMIIDTGSTITYIPCKGCAHCGKHQDEWFDPDASSTCKKLDCNDPLCNCGSPSCTCNNNRCYYSRTYAERSSSEGWLIEDAFGFPDDKPPVRLVFGCENGETGEIYRQMADGIMGMGNNHNAFQSQLVARGIIDDVFSLCFGYPRDGVLLLGDVAMPSSAKTIYTPLLNNLHLHYYNVKMEGVTVAGVQLPLDMSMFDRGYGVVLDSGTTFTYLPTEAFKAMSQAVGKFAEAHGLKPTPGADPQYNDICWKDAPDSFDQLHSVFPPAEFVFGGNARLTLPPLRYLFLSRPGEYCLGFFDNGGAGTLIGGVSVRDVVVTYDRRQNRVGFTIMPCANVATDMATRPVNRSSQVTTPNVIIQTGSAAPATSPSPPPKAAPAKSPSPASKATTPPPKPSPTPVSPPPPSSLKTESGPTKVQPTHLHLRNQSGVTGSPPAGSILGDTMHSYEVTTNALVGKYNINFPIILAVLMAIAAMFLVAEVVFLRRNSALVGWVQGLIQRFSQARQAQNAEETAPLAASAGKRDESSIP